MKILVTGAKGFIGKNLCNSLSRSPVELFEFTKEDPMNLLYEYLSKADVVCHLAGANRPEHPSEFVNINYSLTKKIVDFLIEEEIDVKFIFASSIQADFDNDYGSSKRRAELEVERLSHKTNSSVSILRLPNVFGKWSKPNYNSAIATFCYNMARDIPVEVHNPNASISVLYIDDLVTQIKGLIFYDLLNIKSPNFVQLEDVHELKLSELTDLLEQFKEANRDISVPNASCGLRRALYATYLSFLNPSDMILKIEPKEDQRGKFSETFRTGDFGQVSFFTCNPGEKRGGHYHDTKNERFLILNGTARFIFTNIMNGSEEIITASGEDLKIIQTPPGWAHTIENISEENLICVLWANEVFDQSMPDTYTHKKENKQ